MADIINEPDDEESRYTDAAPDLAAVLEDFLDEEVVDAQGLSIGTLACYWESADGHLVFLGVMLDGQDDVHIVPGKRSQVDERQSCIRLGFEQAEVKSAPEFDCAKEMDAALEQTVYEHFHIAEPKAHGGLRHVTHPAPEEDDKKPPE